MKFLQWISKILSQLLTGKDNQTHDVMRWGLAFAVLFIAALVTWQEYLAFRAIEKALHNNVKDVAQAFALLFGGAGAGIWAKKSTEPGG